MRHVVLLLAAAIIGGSLILSAWMLSHAIDAPTELEQARRACRALIDAGDLQVTNLGRCVQDTLDRGT